MQSSSTLFKGPQLLEVEMEHYQYVPKDAVPQNMAGFVTKNVCECTCGLITSDQGYAFFHFYRINDANHLAQTIQRDFQNATNIKLTIIGGNPTTLFLPWSAENRNIDVFTSQFTSGMTSLKDVDGLMYIRNALATESDQFTKFKLDEKFYAQLTTLAESCIKEKNKRNLITYDFVKLNVELRSKEFFVYGFDREWEFKVHSMKDLIAYQNLSYVLDALYKTNLFNPANVTHFNSPAGYDVLAKLNGNCGAYDENDPKWEKYSICNDKALPSPQLINPAKKFEQGVSLDKQNIVALKTVKKS